MASKSKKARSNSFRARLSRGDDLAVAAAAVAIRNGFRAGTNGGKGQLGCGATAIDVIQLYGEDKLAYALGLINERLGRVAEAPMVKAIAAIESALNKGGDTLENHKHKLPARVAIEMRTDAIARRTRRSRASAPVFVRSINKYLHIHGIARAGDNA